MKAVLCCSANWSIFYSWLDSYNYKTQKLKNWEFSQHLCTNWRLLSSRWTCKISEYSTLQTWLVKDLPKGQKIQFVLTIDSDHLKIWSQNALLPPKPKRKIMSPHSDFRQHIHRYFKSKWQTIWDSQIDNNLHKVKPNIGITYFRSQLDRR